MDRFRIQSLVEMLESEVLTDSDKTETLRMLEKKIKVFIKGAKKRGKTTEVDYYNELLVRFGMSCV